jgi:hypothetical protein
LSGSHPKAPGFAGGYLLVKLRFLAVSRLNVEPNVVSKLRLLRQPDQSYSDVILRLRK